MSLIEPIRREVAVPAKIKKHSASIRLWHWLNVIIISGSLITVLINATLTNKKSTTPVIKKELASSGLAITDKQAGAVAHAISDNTWGVHIYFGYGLAVLLFFRIVLEFFQLADQKFIRKMRLAYMQFKAVKKNRELALHELTVKGIYSFFYITLIVIVVTGLSLAFEDELTMLTPYRHTIKNVHGFCMYLVIGFIIVHLAGVLLAEFRKDKGIVSDMIHGGNKDEDLTIHDGVA